MSLPTPARLLKEYVIAMADAEHRQYPQYRDHWSGPEWRVATITRDIRTKMGVAFVAGDVTIVRPDDDPHYVTAYSARNRIDTTIPASRVRYLEKDDDDAASA